MEVKAKARFIRMSPRKIRLVVNLVRGLDVDDAVAQLRFLNKAAARPVYKLIESARANAENNFKLNPGSLFIKTITVDGGPVLKRWMPRAFGRATPVRKRTAHITVVLDERGVGSATAAAKAVVGATKEGDDTQAAQSSKARKLKSAAMKSAKASAKKPAAKKPSTKK